MSETNGNHTAHHSEHPIEPDAHSFIVQVWFEEQKQDSHKLLWRGRITHVGSGKQQYITHLNSITHFIAAYLPPQSLGTSIWRHMHHFWSLFKKKP